MSQLAVSPGSSAKSTAPTTLEGLTPIAGRFTLWQTMRDMSLPALEGNKFVVAQATVVELSPCGKEPEPPTKKRGSLTLIENPRGASAFSQVALSLVAISGAMAMLMITIRIYALTRHPRVALFFVSCTASFCIICYNALSLEVSFKLWLQRYHPTFRNLSIVVAVVLGAIPLGIPYLMRPKDFPTPSSSQVASLPIERPSPPVDRARPKTGHDGEPNHTVVLTDVRYWSGITSTTVAIDLDNQVQYEVHRIAGPNRIYLDLLGSKLNPALLGRRFQIKNALLRQIRVAEHQPDWTRVTLETNSLCDYSVTLIPNSHRLLIELRK